jgi:chemosensory pili system protein ChpA (sensor histidine kinase/response regulator)
VKDIASTGRVASIDEAAVAPATAVSATPAFTPTPAVAVAPSAPPPVAIEPPLAAPAFVAAEPPAATLADAPLASDDSLSLDRSLPSDGALQSESSLQTADSFRAEESVQGARSLEFSRSMLVGGRDAAAAPERQELARVDADLLDSLLNNAGEVSIFRARLEQQLSSVEFNLTELGRVTHRLKEQLRSLELETEAQILTRHGESRRSPDFDPLEMDQYSAIHQYSRALAESASDVASIQGLLESLAREAQNLLMQQARVVTDLQNGLMRTRMVPFSRHVQRLTRIVRQVASETGKKTELFVQGGSGELDRQVLERMLPPFEHMLRNSVVHGIESPAERAAKGKPETGRIDVQLKREGAEVVIVVADDGAGVNLRAVRDKAVSLGMIDPKQSVSDEEAMQLILEPGFSTATTLTQAAGRGVGMDVVATEIKKLGGALHMETTAGKGTRFTIRLPFTLAISQALIVRAADEMYALPLPTVEGVVRLSKADVQKHLAEEQSTYEYGGQRYRFQHLGAFVGLGASALPETDAPVPVVLVRAGESSTALVTDELVGSREIVVKSVGPQISGIRGIAGATILGDGRIVIILDMGSLVRADWRARPPQEMRDRVDRRTFALVVDDSITVRRVTQRLLERNGMRVLTAKDGADAMQIMQDHVPDVILLDIEMPRMDGYEVAAAVRNDARLREVPIVMITSRVGEKHRARAIELGVDDYLGKPYQENQLLDAIEPLVNRRRVGEAV